MTKDIFYIENEKTLEKTLEKLHNEIDEFGYNPTYYNIYDDEDMIIFALNYLLSNLDDAFVETVNNEEVYYVQNNYKK